MNRVDHFWVGMSSGCDPNAAGQVKQPVPRTRGNPTPGCLNEGSLDEIEMNERKTRRNVDTYLLCHNVVKFGNSLWQVIHDTRKGVDMPSPQG